MINTLEAVLIETSQMLNETSTDVSTKRIGFASRSFNYVVSQRKWTDRRKLQVLVVSAGIQEYDLTSSSNITDGDYDEQAGIYEVYDGNTKLDPCAYSNLNALPSSQYFSLSPDGKKIVFSKAITAAGTFNLWYYAKYIKPVSYTSTLTLKLPDSFLIPIATYTKHLVHDSRRQRTDARNCLLDVQEQLSDLVMADAKHRIKGLPKNIPSPMGASNFKRNYRF